MGRGDLEPEQIVRLEPGAVVLLDQRRLPDEEVELRCGTAGEVAEAIRTLAVRGAVATGVAAAYGYAPARARAQDPEAAYAMLAGTRPTAVDVIWALEQVRGATDPAAAARRLHRAEVARCERMARHALELLAPGSTVYTHCNAGALALAGYGSALGVVRAGFERGVVARALAGETRALLQGARLTAWELERLGIRHAVVADSAAGWLMARGEDGVRRPAAVPA